MVWPWKREPMITPGQKTLPGYAGPCQESQRTEQIRAFEESQFLARNEFETLLEDLNRRHDNLARRVRYRKTMRGRHLPVR